MNTERGAVGVAAALEALSLTAMPGAPGSSAPLAPAKVKHIDVSGGANELPA